MDFAYYSGLPENSGLEYDQFSRGGPGCTCTCAGCTGSWTCCTGSCTCCTGGAGGCSGGAGGVADSTGGGCAGGSYSAGGSPSAMVVYICSLT